MINFTPAEELKPRYQVFGSFYKLHTNNDEPIECRSALEIFKKNNFPNLGFFVEQCKNIPDAMVIMMNPGSSSPLNGVNNNYESTYELSELSDNILSNKMVLAKKDATQYQIMRIMDFQKWNHVRILNLSDIREPKSKIFIRKIKDFEKKNGQIHSIFSEERCDERKRTLSKKETNPIIVAWGCNKHISELAKKAINYLDCHTIAGLCHSGKYLFRHPLPPMHEDRKDWLEKILKKLNE